MRLFSRPAAADHDFTIDERLVEKARASDREFNSIVERYYHMVFAVGYAHLRDPESAEELVQETFLRAYLHLGSLKDARTLPAWLNRIARNLALQWLEKGQNRSRLVPTVSMETLPPTEPDPGGRSPRETAEQKDEQRRVLAAVEQLPVAQREIVIMHFLEDVHKSEIARRLNVHPATVGRQLTAALNQLREQLTATPGRLAGMSQRSTAGATALVASAAGLNASAKSALVKATADSAVLAATTTLQSAGLFAGGKLSGGVVTAVLAAGAITVAGVVAVNRQTSDARTHRDVPEAESIATSTRAATRSSAPAANTPGPGIVTAPSGQRPTPGLAGGAALVDDLSKPGDADTSEPKFIRGRVVDKAGKPLEGCLVDVWSWTTGQETYTNRDGWFRCGGVARDNVPDFRVSKDGYTPYYTPAPKLGVLTEPIVLEQGTWIEGTVFYHNGKPAPGALVRANMGIQQGKGVQITEVWYEAYSNAAGQYKIYLPPSTYALEVKAGNEATTMARIPLAKDEGKKLDLQLSAAATLQVRLIDSITSEPVVGATVSDWQRPTVKGTANEKGLIEIAGLIPAKVDLDVKAKGYARFWLGAVPSSAKRVKRDRSGFNPNISFQRDFDSLDVQLVAPITSITMTMEKAATFRGTVVDPNGQPVSGATVAPAMTGTGNSITGDTRFSVKTDASGSFECPLPASFEDNYNLIAHDGAYQEWRQWANGFTPVVHTEPGQEVDGLVIKLTHPCEITGKVIDTKGQAVAGASVQSTSARKDENRYYTPSVKTAADGSFELNFVPPGEQFVRLGQYYGVPNEHDPKDSYVRLNLSEGGSTGGITLVQYRKEE
ncbi:MAG: sigma-70 family RNA polymerase sigma factor [Candidatus Sumerlaeaceae bacterium]